MSIQSRRETVDALRVEIRANNDDLLTGAGELFRSKLELIPAVSGIEDNLFAWPATITV